MDTDRPLVKRLSATRKELLRGDSWFALLIFTVISVFLFSLVASVWNNIMFQRDVTEKAGAEHVKAVGEVLAKAAEALMTVDELSALRRTIVEIAREHSLKQCRIVLPDGGILADADPDGINVLQLPPTWTDEVSAHTEQSLNNTVKLTFPLVVPGRGSALLEVAAGTEDRLEAAVAPQTAQMAIACLALASMLLVHRHARFRLKAIGAIQEVLLAFKDDNVDIATLELDPKLGLEAVAWNKLLGEKQSRQIRTVIQQVKETVHEKPQAADELTAAFDAVPYGLVLVNDRGQIEHVNGAAAVLLQNERTSLIRANVTDAIKDERVAAAITDVMDHPSSKRVVMEVEQGGAGACGVLRYTLCPVRHDGAHLGLVTIEDVTQQRVAQSAMNSFLAKAAHELRTPLTNIRLYVENALEHYERDTATTGKGLNVINEEAQRLERSVSEILSVSQIEAGSFELRRDDVHLDLLLRQLQSDHEPQAAEKRIKLEFDLPPKLPVLQADRDKISLVLHNLLGNALKYTLSDGRVAVTAACEKGRLNIAVNDTGIGIAQDEVERVFEKFYRARDPQVANIKGSGLGLAIARDIARLHGGDIVLESEPGKGSTFTLVLPAPEEAA